MKTPAIPDNEVERLRSLNATGLLDTEYEERFDRLTRIARNVFGVKIALVTLVDRNRQWFKSCQGLEVRETPRDVSFCGHAILQRDVFVVENSLTDPRFADNPLVTEQPEIRFYAGAPLNSPDGYRIGTLCVIDDQPRRFSAEDRQSLRDLADCVEEEIGKSLRRRYYQALEALAAIRVDARSDLQSCLREGLSLGCEYLRLP
ncbi:MAG: GAF domain-containing protein, partial [Marinobacter sp.]|nr:GAF domain-containing protein [Marinobacter sp.]